MSNARTRRLRTLAPLIFAAASEVFTPPLAADESTASVLRVEEDWVLEVAVPDAATNAPQVSTVIAPTADVDYAYAEFDVNHHSLPGYVPGGLQLQVWSGNVPLIVNNDPDGGLISQPGETVSWTQCMNLADGLLTLSIEDGRSTTWGSFGADGRLAIRVAASLENLNGYSTEVSLANSGVGYASNRVKVLKIVAVRRFMSDGQMTEDRSPRVVVERN